MLLSKRIISMQESPIRKLVPYAQAAKKQGKKVYHLNIGQPDIETPASFMDSIKKFDEKILAYSLSNGSTELINCMSLYYAKHGIDFKNDEIRIAYILNADDLIKSMKILKIALEKYPGKTI